MKLVIVESPTKARKLTGYLGKDFKVESSVGHVRDLPKKTLGVDVEKNFEPTYEISEDKKKVVATLKKLAKSADQIYLAMDQDREGEAIAWHLKHILSHDKTNKKKPEFLRSTFNEITKSAVLKAIENPGKLAMNLVDAQQARRVLDRLVGYKVSPVLWSKVRRGLSAGRVQSVALRLIAEREKEIEAFKPEEYWKVEVGLDTKEAKVKTVFKEGKAIEGLPEHILVVNLAEIEGEKIDKVNREASEGALGYKKKITTLNKEKQVKPIVEDLKKASYQIEDIEKKERQRQSFPPFTTSTLQQAAATRYGYSSKQTMRLAQQLYEEGLITYHRTDSFNLSTKALGMARDYISREFGDKYLPATTRVFKSKSKNAQEAHEAIRVTDVTMTKDMITEKSRKFDEKHAKLYDLIWRRFLASQMTAAVYDQSTVFVKAKKGKEYLLKATGSIKKFDGWTRLFDNNSDKLLPEVNVGQDLNYLDINPLQKFTQPPPRFNDASLVKELEKKGIGRPSTYASIISVIQTRGYVEKTEKKFFPTVIGMLVSDFLVKNFKDIMDYDFTAELEEDLDRISRGEKEWKAIVKVFWEPLAKEIKKVSKDADRVEIPVEKTGEKCPQCGDAEKGEIVIRTGRYGKFKSCSRYPDCKFTENIVEKLEGQNCPLCKKGEIIVKKTRWGKDFFGCGRYPDCDWASWKKPEPGLTVTKKEWEEIKKKREEWKKKRGFGKYKKKDGKAKSTKKSGKKKTAKKKT